MARPARFSADDVLDATLRGVVEHGPGVTVAQVAAQLGGPVGSIYHRFGSREELTARLWLRSIGRFQEGMLALGGAADPHEALVASARHVVRYCSDHPDEALALRLHRQDRLLADARLPEPLRAEVAGVNERLDAVQAELAARRYGRPDSRDPADLRRVVLATRVAPYGLIRPWLGGPLDPELEDAAAVTAAAILALGDPPHTGPGRRS